MADTRHIEARVNERLDELSPPWLQAMRAERDRVGQARAAARIGISEATYSQVLSGTYKASTLRIERRARGELLGETCACPVMFDPSLRVCQDVQDKKSLQQIGNPQHMQAWLACRGIGRFEAKGPCPHFNGASKAQQPTPNPAPKEAS